MQINCTKIYRDYSFPISLYLCEKSTHIANKVRMEIDLDVGRRRLARDNRLLVLAPDDERVVVGDQSSSVCKIFAKGTNKNYTSLRANLPSTYM